MRTITPLPGAGEEEGGGGEGVWGTPSSVPPEPVGATVLDWGDEAATLRLASLARIELN